MRDPKKKNQPITDAEREHNHVNWLVENFIASDYTANGWVEMLTMLLEVGHDHLHDEQLKSAMQLLSFINHMQLVKQKQMREKLELA